MSNNTQKIESLAGLVLSGFLMSGCVPEKSVPVIPVVAAKDKSAANSVDGVVQSTVRQDGLLTSVIVPGQGKTVTVESLIGLTPDQKTAPHLTEMAAILAKQTKGKEAATYIYVTNPGTGFDFEMLLGVGNDGKGFAVFPGTETSSIKGGEVEVVRETMDGGVTKRTVKLFDKNGKKSMGVVVETTNPSGTTTFEIRDPNLSADDTSPMAVQKLVAMKSGGILADTLALAMGVKAGGLEPTGTPKLAATPTGVQIAATETPVFAIPTVPKVMAISEPIKTPVAEVAAAVTKEDVNIRLGPGTNYGVNGGLSMGTKITVMGRSENGWYQVKLMGDEGGGKLGWVLGDLLDVNNSGQKVKLVTPSPFERISAGVELRSKLVKQTHNLSCESATGAMLAEALGKAIPEGFSSWEEYILAKLPRNDDPNLGFRGNPDGPVGGTKDYGVYAQPIADVLNKAGVPVTVEYGPDYGAVKKEVLSGKLVIIWVDSLPGGNVVIEKSSEGKDIKLKQWEHVQVVYGVDGNGNFLVHDPYWGNKVLKSFGWQDYGGMRVVLQEKVPFVN